MLTFTRFGTVINGQRNWKSLEYFLERISKSLKIKSEFKNQIVLITKRSQRK